MPIIQSVVRALTILDLFDEQTTELKITEISTQMGLHKSTVHSLLKTLQEANYIEQNLENGKYRLGMKLVERGNLVISTFNLRNVARKYLLDLSIETGQTSHLGILDGDAGVYIDKKEGEKALIRYSRIGKRIPLHSTAIGKILLAYQNEENVKKLLSDYVFTPLTNKTIMNHDALRKELDDVIRKGHAIDNEENEPGVRCIAVPIKNLEGELLAAVSISTLVSNVNDEQLQDYLNLLKDTGAKLSEEVRYGTAT
ncbi:IclR family transcriptional regulator [Halalkalibacter sp. APA_J-10(15)]|uniref:IclR family transcriptional regulator n=1 Tax=unclassified Halalkalibacter TaxID=2893063 RepID=UPI001FF51FA2|nr:IclR family transcriptional regulator [Halalkalibacter sp. APA_J-10(15)]MCK0470535.1 IclR family transcriptional regulator [Halalkalibacter sp. APA_J-10(15)]